MLELVKILLVTFGAEAFLSCVCAVSELTHHNYKAVRYYVTNFIIFTLLEYIIYFYTQNHTDLPI